MVCSGFVRDAVIQSARIGTLDKGRLRLGSAKRVLHEFWGSSHPWICQIRRFRTGVKMMIDTGSTGNRGSIVNALPGSENNGGYATGGCKSEDGKLSCGYSSFRGKRASMEDFYDVKMSKVNDKIVCLFGIFDGHGGSRAAEYLKQHLFENLMKHPQFLMDTKLAISETYKQTDKDFLDGERDAYRDDGSTASTAVLIGDHLYVANVGDSRAVVSKAGRAIPLSEDHKPNRQDERKRIENAGGVVMWAGTWRVGGVLAMSRAFGNRMLKQYVVAEPEIQEQIINDELELLVLASDGLWDVIANEDALSIAGAEEEPEAAARKLTETAFTHGSADNITCIVVKFNQDKANSVGRSSDQHEEAESELDQSKEAEHQQDQSNMAMHSKDSESLHAQRNEPEILQEECKEPEILRECKDPEILQDMLKVEAPIDQSTETKLQRGLEGPSANFSVAETLASG